MKIVADTSTFHFYNANPKNRRTGDCVVRAIATATGKTWEEVLTGLTEMALKHKQMVNCPELYDKYLQAQGWVKHKQPRKPDNKKYTGAECVKLFKGTAVANIGGNHTVCIKDGKVWDIWDSTGGCIGNYWTKP